MSDFSDLPLFSGIPTPDYARVGKFSSPPRKLEAEPAAPHTETPAPVFTSSALVMPFPVSRDVRLVADLAKAFTDLRQRHGRRCRAMLLTRRFKPIAGRLRQIGVPAARVDRELVQLEAAVARQVWRLDGCPSFGTGGGYAA